MECNISSYDLTPIKGTHLINVNERKYFINICIPGAKGIGGIMEFNNTNYVSKNKNLISKHYIYLNKSITIIELK